MRATMSTLGSLALCAWWARPEARWTYDPPGPAAAFGTKVHELVAVGISGGAMVSQDPAASSLAKTVLEWHAGLGQDWQWRAEPAYVLSVEGRAKHIGDNIGRNYPRLAEHEVAGSADIVGINGLEASVWDVKTGRRENVDPASDNLQLRTLALAVHLAHGVERVRVGLVFPTATGVIVDEHAYDSYDLAGWQAELAALVESIPASQPRPGKKQCQYCKAKASCPAMSEALATAAPKTRLPLALDVGSIQSPEHAAEQYKTLRAAKAALDAAWGALRQYVDANGSVDLGDGRAYGVRQTRRESIDLSTKTAVEVLREELGPAWEHAVTLETSKTAIKDAAKSMQTGESAAAVERRVVDALRRVGAVKTTTSNTYDEKETAA